MLIRNLSILLIFTALFYSNISAQKDQSTFKWPEGKKAAISLSFDDARLSNVDVGLPFFKKHEIKVTYYVVPSGMEARLDGWKEIVKDGHEIGNHTLYHPCTGNFPWAREKALETYSIASMRSELISANEKIHEMLGVVPRSFAYSCGQTFVGRGANTQSYVPLIDELFTSGRGWMDEAQNDPMFTDMAQLTGIEMDGKDFKTEILPMIKAASDNGNWLLLAGHEIGEGGRQTTQVKMLEELIAYAKDPKNGIWLAPVGEIADYVNQQKTKAKKNLKKSLSFYAPFDGNFQADFSLGNGEIQTASKSGPSGGEAGIHTPNLGIAKGKGLHGDALEFRKKGGPAIFYKAKDNIAYDTKNWNGTVSLWLSLDPEKDLAPGYTDPIQITDVTYNDAAIWVDFSKENPRSFRMGVYGDLKEWNPKNLPPDNNPAFDKRLLPATDRPFGTGVWTHIVVTYSGLNSEKGTANFYINGKHQGSREITEPFTWELEKAKIFLGLGFIGLMDEVSIFDRALSGKEVKFLYELADGVGGILR